MADTKKAIPSRTTKSLRDMLFDEIEELRTGQGNPNKSLAVSRLAGQIINIARAEMEFRKEFETGKAVQGPRDLLEAASSAEPKL